MLVSRAVFVPEQHAACTENELSSGIPVTLLGLLEQMKRQTCNFTLYLFDS